MRFVYEDATHKEWLGLVVGTAIGNLVIYEAGPACFRNSTPGRIKAITRVIAAEPESVVPARVGLAAGR